METQESIYEHFISNSSGGLKFNAIVISHDDINGEAYFSNNVSILIFLLKVETKFFRQSLELCLANVALGAGRALPLSGLPT